MIGVKKIIYENNNKCLIINVDNENEVLYNGISIIVDSKIIFKYLEGILSIVEGWQNKYNDTKTSDENIWNLSIIYVDNSKKYYSGKASYPTNFEAFERLNQLLIDEVLNG